jgi:hypothetical protein
MQHIFICAVLGAIGASVAICSVAITFALVREIIKGL